MRSSCIIRFTRLTIRENGEGPRSNLQIQRIRVVQSASVIHACFSYDVVGPTMKFHKPNLQKRSGVRLVRRPSTCQDGYYPDSFRSYLFRNIPNFSSGVSADPTRSRRPIFSIQFFHQPFYCITHLLLHHSFCSISQESARDRSFSVTSSSRRDASPHTRFTSTKTHIRDRK